MSTRAAALAEIPAGSVDVVTTRSVLIDVSANAHALEAMSEQERFVAHLARAVDAGERAGGSAVACLVVSKPG